MMEWYWEYSIKLYFGTREYETDLNEVFAEFLNVKSQVFVRLLLVEIKC